MYLLSVGFSYFKHDNNKVEVLCIGKGDNNKAVLQSSLLGDALVTDILIWSSDDMDSFKSFAISYAIPELIDKLDEYKPYPTSLISDKNMNKFYLIRNHVKIYDE